MADNPLSSTRPYVLRAMHEWMTDNNQTPLVVVDATVDGVVVPAEHVKDGRIVFNVAWTATRNLLMENEQITFQARFGGVPHAVTLPLKAVQGIYARDSGQGMVFQDEPGDAEEAAGVLQSDSKPAGEDAPKPRPGGPSLRIVK
jgi:stringent starvation protein B